MIGKVKKIDELNPLFVSLESGGYSFRCVLNAEGIGLESQFYFEIDLNVVMEEGVNLFKSSVESFYIEDKDDNLVSINFMMCDDEDGVKIANILESKVILEVKGSRIENGWVIAKINPMDICIYEYSI